MFGMKRKKALFGYYKDVFDSKSGEEVLRHLMEVGFVTRPTYVPGDSHETAHREGKRQLVLNIVKQVGMDPRRVEELFKEEIQDDDEELN